MALIGSQFVGDATAQTVERVLNSNTWLIAGRTCNDEYSVTGAGSITIPVDNTADTVVSNNHEITSEVETFTEVPLLLNQVFKNGKKVYGYTQETVPFDVSAMAEISITEANRRGRQKTALAILVSSGTVLTDTTAITKNNVKEKILAARQAVVVAGGNPDVLVVSPDTYTCLLSLSGAEFTPVINEEAVTTGRIGLFYGALVFENNDMKTGASYSYTNDSNVVTAVDCSLVEFVMYDSSKFACVDAMSAIQKAPGATFIGTNILAEITSGLKLTRATCAVVKKKLA